MSSAELLASVSPTFKSGLVVSAPSFRVPGASTAPSTLQIDVDGSQQVQTATLTMTNTDPEQIASGEALQFYATRPALAANSYVVARPGVSSAALTYPSQSLKGAQPGYGAHLQLTANDEIQCPSITGNCVIKFWIAGATAAALADAGGIVEATLGAVQSGVSFQITGSPGVKYGWEIMYA